MSELWYDELCIKEKSIGFECEIRIVVRQMKKRYPKTWAYHLDKELTKRDLYKYLTVKDLDLWNNSL